MKRIIFAGLALLVSISVMAQQVMKDGSRVLLPLSAQHCNLPSAPPPVPTDPDKAKLMTAQKFVKQFQQDMETYRACINHDLLSPELSKGNLQAITDAHNYTVEMEERVAGMFNEAVRAYKAKQAGN